MNHESGNAKYVGTFSAEKPEIVNILWWTSYWPGQEQPWYALGTSSFMKCARTCSYVKELSKHIPVTVEGKYGSISKCSRFDKDCSRKLKKQHKFYLSFENSLCTDYYTEKVIDALRDNVVPIIYGFVGYETILQPKPYIDV